MSLERIQALLEPDPRLVERVTRTDPMWDGRIFCAEHLAVRLSDGTEGWRDIVRHHGGCGVCVIRDQKMCLVRQYRVALGRMTLEIPAGKIDPGEDAATCAARELAEETGLVAGRLELLAVSAGAPGFTNERTRIFVARDVTQGPSAPDEGELVDVVWLPVPDVVEAVRAGLIEDAKTVISALAAAAGMA